MLAAHLAFQAIDLLLALAGWSLCAWLARRLPVRALAHRFPVALATPMRRELLLVGPLFLALMAGAGVAGKVALFPVAERLLEVSPRWQRAITPGSFLVMGVTWLAATVVLPLRLQWLAWRARAGDARTRARRRDDRVAAAAVSAALAALLVRASFVEPAGIVLEHAAVEVAGWPEGRPPLRIALVADVQSGALGARERRVPELVRSLEPDVVLIAGDLVAQSFDEATALEQARWLLGELRAPLGVYVVNGDVDDVVEGGMRRIVEGTGVRLLDNDSVVLACDPPVEVVGIDPRQEARMAAVLERPARAALRIGLVHRPRHWKELARAGCGLVLAGHTHGGQVVVPGFGPPITLEVVPRQVAAGGLHRMDERTLLYVTRGVGLEGGFAPRIRLNCPPEITLIEYGRGEKTAEVPAHSPRPLSDSTRAATPPNRS